MPEEQFVAELVREQLLAVTRDELPYSIATRVDGVGVAADPSRHHRRAREPEGHGDRQGRVACSRRSASGLVPRCPRACTSSCGSRSTRTGSADPTASSASATDRSDVARRRRTGAVVRRGRSSRARCRGRLVDRMRRRCGVGRHADVAINSAKSANASRLARLAHAADDRARTPRTARRRLEADATDVAVRRSVLNEVNVSTIWAIARRSSARDIRSRTRSRARSVAIAAFERGRHR